MASAFVVMYTRLDFDLCIDFVIIRPFVCIMHLVLINPFGQGFLYASRKFKVPRDATAPLP